MIFRPKTSVVGSIEPDDLVYVVAANLKWALLIWPMRWDQSSGLMQPCDSEGSKLKWYFTTSFDQHEAAMFTLVLQGEIGLAVAQSEWEPSVKAMLRNHSLEMTFKELSLVADMSGLDLKNMSREKLLRHLCMHFGDLAFAELVAANEEKNGKKRKKKSDGGNTDDDEGYNTDDSLAEMIFENMDAGEADDFSELKKRISNRHMADKKRKWSQWKKEHEEAVLAQNVVKFTCCRYVCCTALIRSTYSCQSFETGNHEQCYN